MRTASLLALVPLFSLLAACGGSTTDEPAADASTDASVLDGAGSDTSRVDAPASDAPASDVPASDVPASDAPASDAPAADGGAFGACTGPGQCVLALKGCCYPCGAPTLDTFSPVNEASKDAYTKTVCPDPSMVACPKCATILDKSLMSFCEAGACAPIDLRQHPFSSCSSDADCTLRTAECCECGGDTSLPVALNRASLGAYADAVCKKGTACKDCAPLYPADKKAVCDPKTKHCVVSG